MSKMILPSVQFTNTGIQTQTQTQTQTKMQPVMQCHKDTTYAIFLAVT